MSKNTRNRILLTALAALLLVVVAVGGTVAYLKSTTATITNTFSPAGIKIDLTETLNTDSDNDGTNDKWTAHLIPGKEYKKDPIVSVDRNKTDVDIWLFVKFEPGEIGTYVDYNNNMTSDNGWTAGKPSGENANGLPLGVYYRKVLTTDATSCGVTGCTADNPHWHLLVDDKVKVHSHLAEGETYMPASDVEMKYTAYAIQTEGFDTAKDAWDEINGN